MSTSASQFATRIAALKEATRLAQALAQGLTAEAPLRSASTAATRSVSLHETSSTSTPAKPQAVQAAPIKATNTDDGASGTNTTENMAAIPQTSANRDAQLRTTKLLLSVAMSLLIVAFALISIHNLIPANTTASTAVMGITTLLMLLIQLCIAYVLLPL